MNEEKKETEFIRLDQLLKFYNLAESGGVAKLMIQDGLVAVNGDLELRRGRKLYEGDVVELETEHIVVNFPLDGRLV